MSATPERDFLDHQAVSRLGRLTLRPRGLVEGSFAGKHKSPHHGASVEFAEYRKYVPGDDIRHIDWRAYARSDRFYMKEFEADTHMRCYMVIDSSGSMGFAGLHGTKLDYAKRLVSMLSYLVVHQSDHVGLHCFNEKVVHDIPPRGKPSHLRHIFDTLVDLQPAGETDMVSILHDLAERIRQRALVIVFSDFFTDPEPLLSCFQHMRHRKHDLAVFHLLDPQELNFAFDRPIKFNDLESTFSLVAEPTAIRNQYQQSLHRYLETMRRSCGQHGVDYRLVRTSDDEETVLSDFILERLGRPTSSPTA